jgi:hypothetical protein
MTVEAEKNWVRKFIREAISQGCSIFIDHDEGDPAVWSVDEDSLMDDICACSTEFIRVRKPNGSTAEVMCIYGNADEVFADWNMSLDPIMKKIGYLED